MSPFTLRKKKRKKERKKENVTIHDKKNVKNKKRTVSNCDKSLLFIIRPVSWLLNNLLITLPFHFVSFSLQFVLNALTFIRPSPSPPPVRNIMSFKINITVIRQQSTITQPSVACILQCSVGHDLVCSPKVWNCPVYHDYLSTTNVLHTDQRVGLQSNSIMTDYKW